MSSGSRRKSRTKQETDRSLEAIRTHIKHFCRYQSHHSNKEYVLCVNCAEDMYSLYKNECIDNGIKPEKIEIYCDAILTGEFRINFKIPLHQSCTTCSPITEKLVLSIHENNFQTTNKEYEKDLEASKHTDSDTMVITMCMLPPQPLPVIRETDEDFPDNRWQLLVHSFVMHNYASNDACVCVWPEYIGSCGVDEMASCILKVLPTMLPEKNKNIKNLIIWTDSDFRNKNYTMIFLWIYVVFQGHFQTITHKYFPQGHNDLMETDKVFDLITKKMKRMQCVWTHHDWIRVIKNSKTTGKPFRVVEMMSRDVGKMLPLIKRFSKRETLMNKTEPFDVKKMTAFQVNNSARGIVGVQQGYTDTHWGTLDVVKRKNFPELGLMVIAPKYPRGRRINPELYADLMKVLPYVPQKDVPYFERLNTEGERNEGGEDGEELYIDEPFEY